MNKQELQNKLNEMLVGKSSVCNTLVADYVREHLEDLGIDNSQGEYGVRYDNYTFTIVWRQRGLVSFKALRTREKEKGWIVKQVIVEDEFVDLETSKQRVLDSYKLDIKRYDDDSDFYRFYYKNYNDLETLKKAMKFINEHPEVFGDNRSKTRSLIEDLGDDYWLIITALELDEAK